MLMGLGSGLRELMGMEAPKGAVPRFPTVQSAGCLRNMSVLAPYFFSDSVNAAAAPGPLPGKYHFCVKVYKFDRRE